ncbi:glycosyltransferase family 2 protein [Microbacterium sp. NPDC019599]|uniref:glycosyltransferase family 2 protein n=1 Tax=Microbacterium sp. NPDC019599 TaxID=3154690 RepID=UPI003403F379
MTSLSVVIPTHNVGPWIGETLTSVLDQDLPSMEVIVVDDASTDDTTAVVERFAEADARVRLFRASERGGGSARNRGVAEASGRYLVFCDGDDLIPPGAYAAFVRSLDESGSDIVFGDFLKFSPTDTWRPTASMSAYGRPASGVSLVDEPTLILARPCWNKAFRRDFWQANGIEYPDVPRSNDIVPMVKAYANARSIDIIPDVVYLYRERPGGTSMTAKADSVDSMVSYLTQELECARIVAALDDQAVTTAYRRLIWDRDGFIHVAKFAKFAAAREGGHSRDAEVAAAVEELLEFVGPPPAGIPEFKMLTLTLASHAQWVAARVASSWELEYDTPDFEDLAGLLTTLSEIEYPVAAGDRIPWLALRALQSHLPDRTDAGAWADAARALAAFAGPDALSAISEIGSAGTRPDDVTALRTSAAAMIRELRGGTTFVVSGQSVLGADRCAPVLWPVDGTREAIEPESVRWEREVVEGRESGRWLWFASYPRKSLPTHDLFQPAMRLREPRVVVTADSRPPLPEYSVLDSFIYERHRDVVVVYRRRGRFFRAVRRAFIIAGSTAKRVLPRARP